MGEMIKRGIAVALMVGAMGVEASAATLSRTYSYFTIGGRTLGEIEVELSTRGPQVKSTGRRHPGATQMEFTTNIRYQEKDGRCQVISANVNVKANVILPRWKQRAGSEPDVQIFWDTLSADIKRHEEGHVVVAKNHAHELEKALKAIGRQKTCDAAKAKAKEVSAKILAKHDKEQDRFDRVEGINFESRILRLLQYRMERIEDGRLPG